MNKTGETNGGDADGGLLAVALDNATYKNHYTMVLRIAFIVSVIALIEGAGLVGLLTHHPEPRYFAVSGNGSVIELKPLDQPLISSSALQQWAAETARLAYSIDYLRYQQQMTAIRDRFSASAYRDYVAQMGSTGNIEAITTKRLMMDAQTGAAIINGSGVNAEGRYYWQVKVPLTVVRHFGGNQERSSNMEVQMEIVRVDNRMRPESGVAVNSFVVSL